MSEPETKRDPQGRWSMSAAGLALVGVSLWGLLRPEGPWTPYLPSLGLWGLLWAVLPWCSPDDTRIRRAAFWLNCAVAAQFLGWWIAFAFPSPRDGASFAYAALILLLFCSILHLDYHFLKILSGTVDRSPEADRHSGWLEGQGALPIVDILVPTYNESWPILEKTVVGAMSQTYPRVRVWVCDDGRRDWLKDRVEALGASYLTRQDNQGAKAGNLNRALSHLLSLPEPPTFLAVLDADFVPRHRFVSRTIALMHRPKVGIVQTPQCFLNPDPIQNAFQAYERWPDAQRHVFNTLLPSRDASGRVFCVGTSFLARVEALEIIGGFPSESVTEDVLMSSKMMLRGYPTVYLRETLTTGLAAEGLREFLTQRGRWCLGSVQIATWMLGNRELSWWGRLTAAEMHLRWGYTTLARALLALIPAVFWLSGQVPVAADAGALVFHLLPLFVLYRIYLTWVTRGAQLPLVGEAYLLIAGFAVLPAMFRGLFSRGQPRFVVTDKDNVFAGRLVHGRVLGWLLGYAALLIAGIGYRTLWLDWSPAEDPWVLPMLLWTGVNLAIVGVAAGACVEWPQRRLEYRYQTSESVTVEVEGQTEAASLVDLSLSGARLVSGRRWSEGQALRISLQGMDPLEAQVVRRGPGAEAGVAFSHGTESRQALIRRIYCSDRYIRPAETADRSEPLRTLLGRLPGRRG